MTKTTQCPECSARMRANQRKCAQCGWIREEVEPADAGQAHDPDRHKCAWTDGGRRCQYVGAISSSVNGADRWYCRGHYQHMGDPVMGARILDESHMPQPAPPVDWRDELVNTDLDAHPEFFRDIGEPRAGYLERMRKFVRSRWRSIVGNAEAA